MRTVLRNTIVISARQRTDFDAKALADLQASIEARGLLHPPVVSGSEAAGYSLVAGERRLRAIDAIAASGTMFACDGKLVEPGYVPVLLVHELPASDLFALEFEENELRIALSWQDRMRAIAALHELRKEAAAEEGRRQTFTDTAKELLANAPQTTGRLENAGKPITRRVDSIINEISTATIVTRHLNDPTIAKARNEREALQLSLKKEHEAYAAELVRRRAAVAAPQLTCSIRHGDALEIMPRLDAGKFDLILTDPPYGINAGGQGFRDRTVHHHNYDDTPDNARRILKAILTEGYRLCKPKANLFIFTDISHFAWLQEFSAQMAWTPWRFPVIWQKSESEGLVPWSRQGFAHTYDIIFFATKGQRGLLRPHVDILNFSRVKKKERTYAAEKPVDLLTLLIELSTLPGDWVFDPCAGSGSTLVAARNTKRHSFGIEIDRAAADLATIRAAGEEEEETEDSEEDDQSETQEQEIAF